MHNVLDYVEQQHQCGMVQTAQSEIIELECTYVVHIQKLYLYGEAKWQRMLRTHMETIWFVGRLYDTAIAHIERLMLQKESWCP